ncbi:MAG TPA: hypothetical protein VE686_00695 [Beijerinckiaceae bacterium]|jgi:hypothetical protein|nr:hypothetical protein [Beijerinckiaceae bacterium]
MAGQGNTASVAAPLAPVPHLSLGAACLGFFASTLGLTAVMVFLGA